MCLAAFQACWWCLSFALQTVSCLSTLLFFKPVDDTCLWLFREWVAAVAFCVSSLLMMPVLGSPGSVWLQCLSVFHVCWWYLSSTHQGVSGCSSLCFKLTDYACPWLSSLWVAVVSCCVSCSLMMLTPGSSDSEWLSHLATLWACWSFIWFFRMWVAGCPVAFYACWCDLLASELIPGLIVCMFVLSFQTCWHVHLWFSSL